MTQAAPDRASVVVVPTGAANIASVCSALQRLGAAPRIAGEARDVEEADRVVLPGVGAFGAAMTALQRGGLVEPLRRRIAAGRPLLAVCVGLQVLGRASDESPGVEGLGAVDAAARRFTPSPTVRVPQMGWNVVRASAGSRLVENGAAYFANAYRWTTAPSGWAAGWADHDGAYIAAVERGAQLACQFHPELSGAWGLALLERWLQRSGDGSC